MEERLLVIMRMWRGWTRGEDTDAYVAYLKETGLDDYESTPGNQGSWLLSRPDGSNTEFVTLSLWDSLDSIATFAGRDVESAVFYPEDDRYLVDRETRVRHYTVR